jgi:hypothetical protein
VRAHVPTAPSPTRDTTQGEYMASTFYAHARASGGTFAVHKPSPYSAGGGRLHNFNKMG